MGSFTHDLGRSSRGCGKTLRTLYTRREGHVECPETFLVLSPRTRSSPKSKAQGFVSETRRQRTREKGGEEGRVGERGGEG